MTDITNYAEALREVSAAKKEVPGRRGYPGYLYTNLATLYERAGRQMGKEGSITLIPILTMPEDDKTHPISRPDRLHHRGADHPLPGAVPEGRHSPGGRAALPVSSEGQGHRRGQDERGPLGHHEPALRRLRHRQGEQGAHVYPGEAALSPTDLLYAKFADEFEKRYVARAPTKTAPLRRPWTWAGELLSILPRSELKRIKPEYIDKYLPKKD